METEILTTTADTLFDQVERNGFLTTFAVMCLLMLIAAIYYYMKAVKSRNDIELQSEKARHDAELGMSIKEREAALEQNKKLFEHTTSINFNQMESILSIQSEHINQMKDLSVIINNIREDIRDSKQMQCMSDKNMTEILRSYNELNGKIDTIRDMTEEQGEINEEIKRLAEQICVLVHSTK